VLSLGGGAGRSRRAADGTRPSVLLLTIDTLRGDRLSCYGYPRPTSPHMDALAARGTLFSDATCVMPRTHGSFSSIMTGMYPPVHGVRDQTQSLDAAHVTLAEVLRDAGYRTGAVTRGLRAGLDQGFEWFNRHGQSPLSLYDLVLRVGIREERAMDLVEAALDWTDGLGDEPFLLWIRWFDPHWPYGAPDPWGARWAERPAEAYRFNDPRQAGWTHGRMIFGDVLTDEERRGAADLYDGEVAYTDASIGRLLDGLHDQGRTGPFLIVVTADHGESLGEHGTDLAHGDDLYQNTLRVPLLWVDPDQERGRIVTDPVSLVDLAPSVIDRLGLEMPEGVNGHPWTRTWPTGRPRVLFAETGRSFMAENPRRPVPGNAGKWRMARTGRWKLIEIPHPDRLEYELYDLDRDPEESVNLYPSYPDLTRADPGYAGIAPELGPLQDLVFTFRVSDEKAGDTSSTIDAETEAMLRTLGYTN
jgi:arylsulfatase A-like enzyme